MVLNHSAIPKREILPAWRALLGKTCFKNFSSWVGPLKVSALLLLPCFIQQRGFNGLESNTKGVHVRETKMKLLRKKSSCTFQVTGPSTRKIPNSL